MAEHSATPRQVMPIRLTVNGHEQVVQVEPHETLIELIRDRLGLTRELAVAAIRAFVQLLVVGALLLFVFERGGLAAAATCWSGWTSPRSCPGIRR